jgi:hypothetical protein
MMIYSNKKEEYISTSSINTPPCTIILPIYYKIEYKNKKDKNILLSMNWYRNAHYHILNEVKKYYEKLVLSKDIQQKYGKFELEHLIYYSSYSSDPSNIVPIIEKFLLDALILKGTILTDTMTNHLGSTYKVADKDRLNPRIETLIKSKE